MITGYKRIGDKIKIYEDNNEHSSLVFTVEQFDTLEAINTELLRLKNADILKEQKIASILSELSNIGEGDISSHS